MKFQLTGALLALLTLAPAAAMAQEKADSSAPKHTYRYRIRSDERPRVMELAEIMRRPRIGVVLTTDPDRRGARIAQVVGDSPAEKAGLMEGDVITRFNGTAISGEDAASQVSDLAADLDAGDTVKVEYRRDGATKTVSVVADETGPMRAWGMAMPMRRSAEVRALGRLQDRMPQVWTRPDGRTSVLTVFGRGPMGLDLVEMNKGLGEYFGTDSGLLVTEEPRDSTMPLRPGDVILNIAGRVPNNEMHARRILGSYVPGETVKFEIMRKKVKQTVEWKVGCS
jgi:S1-C subfamily serine protease